MIEHGTWERAVELLTAVVERTHGMTSYQASPAMFHARLGQKHDARRHLAAFTDSDFAIIPPQHPMGRGMVLLADPVVRLQDADAAARMRELLEPVVGRTAWPPFTARDRLDPAELPGWGCRPGGSASE